MFIVLESSSYGKILSQVHDLDHIFFTQYPKEIYKRSTFKMGSIILSGSDQGGSTASSHSDLLHVFFTKFVIAKIVMNSWISFHASECNLHTATGWQ